MKKEGYVPPYTITDKIINMTAEISELVGKISVNNKRIFRKPHEIQEDKNASEVYEQLLRYNPFSVKDLLTAHRILMADLVHEAGVFRQDGVGVAAGESLVQMAPPARQVPQLITDLLDWTEKAELHPLIKSCVFHYEFGSIQPFADGNGRMGCMWQTLLLAKWKPIFVWLPVETLIRERQDEYEQALAMSDLDLDAKPLVEFLLQTILTVLQEFADTEQVGDQVGQQATSQATDQVTEQVKRLLEKLGTDTLSARELMERVGLKHRPTFRNNYLVPALEQKLITMTVPDKPNSNRQKYRRL
jgi:Fic family protein